jgi:hypothetical protein
MIAGMRVPSARGSASPSRRGNPPGYGAIEPGEMRIDRAVAEAPST